MEYDGILPLLPEQLEYINTHSTFNIDYHKVIFIPEKSEVRYYLHHS